MTKRFLLLAAVLPLAGLLAAGCGQEGCTTAPADAASTGGSCSVTPGSSASITVTLACQCTDTDAVCDGGYRDGMIDLGTTVHQCQDQAGCSTSGCDTSAHTATCTVSIPADAPAQIPVYVNGNFNTNASNAGGSSCSI